MEKRPTTNPDKRGVATPSTTGNDPHNPNDPEYTRNRPYAKKDDRETTTNRPL